MARAAFLILALSVCAAREARAYSVLAHEANIDAVWETRLRPLLVRRYPRATREEVAQARAYAYGGAVIQDLGYYPFGSHFFSNLVHYTRSGDFVQALLRESHDVNEYAFALGALAHYTADNVGHPSGVNRAVGLMYPKLRAKYGDSVTYADSPAIHVLVEFSFDVVQAASGGYVSDMYQSFVGFQVAKAALERAFLATYGIEMKDVFMSEDLAIGSYRHAVSQTIPEITRIAWRDKREEIQKLNPGAAEEKFIFNLSRREYEKAYGTDYEKPGLLARFLAFLYRLLPKVGPLRPLQFEAPTKAAEALFLESFKESRERFQSALDALGRGDLDLPNTNFDTGRPSVRGEYSLADDTYAQLLDRLTGPRLTSVPDALRANINAFYAAAPGRLSDRKARKRADHVRKKLALLNTKDTKNTKAGSNR
ncbi:MAG TPA: zinc dependent phospholipase C family protein [Vicinamibacterales bacterium]|nr:zinc dependent phospholipase C family protein [Vicinamibacterales bacterium]